MCETHHILFFILALLPILGLVVLAVGLVVDMLRERRK